jgi:hypothetical protein
MSNRLAAFHTADRIEFTGFAPRATQPNRLVAMLRSLTARAPDMVVSAHLRADMGLSGFAAPAAPDFEASRLFV